MRMKRAYLNEEKIFNERRMTFPVKKSGSCRKAGR